MLLSKGNILRAVQSYRDVSFAEIMSPRRGPSRQSGARQEVYYFLKKHTEMSYPDIGNRDHTTVLHGVQRVKLRCQNDLRYAAEISALNVKIIRQFAQKPDVAPVLENIDPTNAAYRIVFNIGKHGAADVSHDEIFAMAAALDKAFDLLTRWCGGNPITDDQLDDMFDALQRPMKPQERIVQ
ncbi:hypothetical protein JI58_03840 [Marinosulfonomonas sp. PRT-SC04]|nr:hypothetical protein JI58_03840 [Marinosulfonomonas sp. PRT-SC04]